MPPAPDDAARPEISTATRERLLCVAERLFAEHGYASVSVRRITTAAGCNLAAVNYHFGGKLGLYREAFQRRLAIMRDRRIAAVRRLTEDPDPGLTVEHVLRTFAEAFLEPFVAESEGRLVLSLISREMVDPQLPPELFWLEMAEPVRRALAAALAPVAPKVEPRALELCIESLVAQLTHAMTLQRLPRSATAPADLPFLEEVTEHIVRFTAAGIRGIADQTRSKRRRLTRATGAP